jgi:hypothetical protein
MLVPFAPISPFSEYGGDFLEHTKQYFDIHRNSLSSQPRNELSSLLDQSVPEGLCFSAHYAIQKILVMSGKYYVETKQIKLIVKGHHH